MASVNLTSEIASAGQQEGVHVALRRLQPRRALRHHARRLAAAVQPQLAVHHRRDAPAVAVRLSEGTLPSA